MFQIVSQQTFCVRGYSSLYCKCTTVSASTELAFIFFHPFFSSILRHCLNPYLNKIISSLIRTLEFIVTGTKQHRGKGKELGTRSDSGNMRDSSVLKYPSAMAGCKRIGWTDFPDPLNVPKLLYSPNYSPQGSHFIFWKLVTGHHSWWNDVGIQATIVLFD